MRESSQSSVHGLGGHEAQDGHDQAHGARGHDHQARRRSSSPAYTDSDHVTVFTPSIAAGIENVSGASLNASYLVDVVSAASVDIVSTASPRWKEVRQAGSADRRVQAARLRRRRRRLGLERARLPLVRRVRDASPRTSTRRTGRSSSATATATTPPAAAGRRRRARRSRSSRATSSAARSTAASLRSSIATSLASLTGDVVIENGDQSKPYRYIPMFSADVARKRPERRVDRLRQRSTGCPSDRSSSCRSRGAALALTGALRARVRRLDRSARGAPLRRRLGSRRVDDATRGGSSTSARDSRCGRTRDFTCSRRSASGSARTYRSRRPRDSRPVEPPGVPHRRSRARPALDDRAAALA